MTTKAERLKVLHITGMDSTKLGSLEKWFLTLADACPDIEQVLVYNTQPQSKKYVEALKQRHICVEVTPCTGRAVVSNLPELWSIVRKHKPDIVHFHFGYSCLTLGTFLHWGGLRTVKTQHSCLMNKQARQLNRLSDFSLTHRLATADGLMYKAMDRITFVGKFVEKQYTDVYGPSDRYRYIPLGIAQPAAVPAEKAARVRRDLGIADDGIMVLSTLFAVPMKGPDILVKAAALLRNPKITVVLVGIDSKLPFAAELEKIIRENGLEERVRLVGITDRVAEYVAACDMYVQPSRTEALGFAAIEAMSASKPVIASNVGGLPEVALRLFEVGDTQRLAEHIEQLAADPARRIEEGREEYDIFRRNYLIDNTLPRMVQMYRDLCK